LYTPDQIPAPPGERDVKGDESDTNSQHRRCRHGGRVVALVIATSEAIVREFWRLMASNDFVSVAAVLAEDLVVEWPQSNERIRGARKFTRMNAEYPANGPWRFTLNRLVAGDREVVTQVSLTDGIQKAEPVSFFTVGDGKITHIVEYWPEPFQPAEGRHHLTEPIT
jgi:ketosteroid isomerase-like protein